MNVNRERNVICGNVNTIIRIFIIILFKANVDDKLTKRYYTVRIRWLLMIFFEKYTFLLTFVPSDFSKLDFDDVFDISLLKFPLRQLFSQCSVCELPQDKTNRSAE